MKVRRRFLSIEALESRIAPAAIVTTASGAETVDIQAAVDAFRTALGAVNHGAGGSFVDGRREVNWDGVPDSFAAPAGLPVDFFNVNSPRGVLLATDGSGFFVSADASNPAGEPVEFATQNAGYPAEFKPFSGERIFSPAGSNEMDVEFRIPGTNFVATSGGFGVVFTGIDAQDTTKVELFDAGGALLNSTTAPAAAGGLSFVGVRFDAGERVGRVHITLGNAVLGTTDAGASSDVVVMDVFIYAEPQAVRRVVEIARNGRSATFTDADGDLVTVKTSRGRFEEADFFVFAVPGPAGAGQLVELRLGDDGVEFRGADVSFTARPGAGGGNGFVNVGHINAATQDLRTVKVAGDLARITAGDNDPTLAAVRRLDAHSMGALGAGTLFNSTSLDSQLDGSLGALNVKAGLRGVSFTLDGENAGFGALVVGGSVIDAATGIGTFAASGGMDSLRIGGDFASTSESTPATIFVEGRIGSIKIGGSMLGARIIIEDGGLGSLSTGGSLAGTRTTNGTELPAFVGVGTQLGRVTIGGDLRDATISAFGRHEIPFAGLDVAIGHVKIAGSVIGSEILAGYDFSAVPQNADASILAIAVRGDWIASSALAGVVPGDDAAPGTRDDEKIPANTVRHQSQRDITTRFATIQSVSIAGQALGTAAALDSFGIVAEEIVKAKIAGQRLVLTRGANSPEDFIALAPTGPGIGGEPFDFHLVEVL